MCETYTDHWNNFNHVTAKQPGAERNSGGRERRGSYSATGFVGGVTSQTRLGVGDRVAVQLGLFQELLLFL